jgi:hypothetical protein
MKNRLILLIGSLLLLLIAHVNGHAQETFTNPVELKSDQLELKNGRVVFTSPGAHGMAEIEVNGENQATAFTQGFAPLPVSVDAKGNLLLLRSPQGQLSFGVCMLMILAETGLMYLILLRFGKVVLRGILYCPESL